jgi:hypothetical protein
MRRCPCESEGIFVYGIYPRGWAQSGNTISGGAG